MEMINQPFSGQLGNRLIQMLESGSFHTLNVVVAFAKNSGVLRIKNALENFRKGGGKVNIHVGVDLGGTSYEALTALLLHADTLNVVHAEKGQTFHPKIYQFLGHEKSFIVVGSHNLTGGGLWTNFESSTLVTLSGSDTAAAHIRSGMDDFFTQLNSLSDSVMPIRTQEDIETLLENGYISKEVTEQVRRSKAAQKIGSQQRLFGYGVTAKLPHLPKSISQDINSPSPPSSPAIVAAVSEDLTGMTIWFETRSLTGGSRNILDLSKKSLVTRGDPRGSSFDLGESNFMRGAVEFFGLNPEDIQQSKDITLNFEGVDYVGNTILFPSGNKANGTWRLQIKGISSTEIKITDAFRAKGEDHYLVEKIITFTKIETDYYFLSVFPQNEMANFEAASQILARNGAMISARKLGIL